MNTKAAHSTEAQRAEVTYRAMLPIFVNSFNQLTYLRDSISWFYRHGFRNVTVIDQNSTYPPLREYLCSPDFEACTRLIRLERNLGPRRALDSFPVFPEAVPYVFTDPDLELPSPPDPLFITRLFAVSHRYKAHKVGLALDISEFDQFTEQTMTDLEGVAHGITDWEKRYWRRPLGDNIYRAPVDTTFHLFNPHPDLSPLNWRRRLLNRPPQYESVRVAGSGFLAKHRPWYRDDGQTAEERRFYRKTGSSWTNWQKETE